ncbi:uncharacterized protein LOC126577541 [Anopheles aquasalis]|uniref:uncharacterized protein LOC126577541 n=1 Tax=Anopheles aquasalis TaxID=42839 RepID=UPI00215B5B40|nr:uncharacterized protein LOC126577541 [Anopheles aquasalis]
MWTPSESDSVPPLRVPRAWKCDDHQHTEQSRIHSEKMKLGRRRLEEGERRFEMDSAAMAKLDSQDLCSDPMSTSSSDSSATAVIRTTTEIEQNTLLVRSVETLATPHNAIEVASNLLSSLMNLFTINIADPKPKPEITINLKCETTAPNRTPTKDVPKVPKKRKTLGNLPPNAAQQDPSVLLAYMRPQTRYVDLGSCYNTKSMSFTASITVDGIVFEGQGSSKKAARKVAAALACRELFGVVSDTVVLD